MLSAPIHYSLCRSHRGRRHGFGYSKIFILRYMRTSGHYVLCCLLVTTVTGLATNGQTGEQRVGAASLICTTQRRQIMHRYMLPKIK